MAAERCTRLHKRKRVYTEIAEDYSVNEITGEKKRKMVNAFLYLRFEAFTAVTTKNAVFAACVGC
jgi:hypothetical protein